MLKLTKKADYGLIALKYLAEHPEKPALSAKDVADTYGIPAQLLAKILQRLTKAGLLRSQAGMNGGYALARDARQISAFEVILAIDGPFFITSCTKGAKGCELGSRNRWRASTRPSPVYSRALVFRIWRNMNRSSRCMRQASWFHWRSQAQS